MSNMIFKISTGTLDAPNMFAFTEYRILIYVRTRDSYYGMLVLFLLVAINS